MTVLNGTVKTFIEKKYYELHKSWYNGDIKFSFEEYCDFLLQHKPNKKYKMINRDKSEVDCEVVYFPLENKDLRALIIIGDKDFREVPVRFLAPREE